MGNLFLNFRKTLVHEILKLIDPLPHCIFSHNQLLYQRPESTVTLIV